MGVALGALIYSGVGPVAVPILLGLGAAVMMIGIGVGIAAAGFGYMLESIGTPSAEQYMAFGGRGRFLLSVLPILDSGFASHMYKNRQFISSHLVLFRK